MTAEEIRKLRDESIVAYKIDGSLDERNQLMFFLSEVAAQLAELNERATEPELEKLRKELREEIAKWRPKGETSI